MAEYIEREVIIKALESDSPELIYYSKQEAIDCIKSLPAADVVEVVRCKDCKFWDFGRCEGIKNGLIQEYTQPDDYCSYGDRAEHVNKG